MGYIDGFEDIMAMETGVPQNIMGLLKRNTAGSWPFWISNSRTLEKIPRSGLTKQKVCGVKNTAGPSATRTDLEPEEESLIGRYLKRSMEAISYLSPIIPAKRPLYAMDDPGILLLR